MPEQAVRLTQLAESFRRMLDPNPPLTCCAPDPAVVAADQLRT